jgi:thiosulfate reductase cytochrome b subunit
MSGRSTTFNAGEIMADDTPTRSYRYYRHRLPVRLMHWINVLCLAILFMSGLGIFNAHPALYWGHSSYTGASPLLEITAVQDEDGDEGEDKKSGVLRVFGHEFDTTGMLGISNGNNGEPSEQGFPHWITLPDAYSLAIARWWHFFFAWLFVINGLIYVLYTISSGHLRRDLAPEATELRGMGASIKDHLRFKHPHGEASKRYNVLQKLTYLIVIFILLPLVILMGMAMSPMLDSLLTGWVNLLGGRQSARTLHFVAAWLILAFVLVHVFEVIITGVWNNLRSMITGYYTVKGQEDHHESA